MSFLPNSEQNQQTPQGQTTAQPGMGTPPPQSGGSAGTGAPKGTATGTPTQFGSSASKLGDYLSANAPQIGQQANNVTQGLNQQYGQVSSDITNAANQFGQSVAGGYAAPNQDIVNQAASNPTQFASNPGNVSAFQGQYNDVYKGPQNFESTTPYGAIQSEVSNAVQTAAPLNTTAGLTNYFAQNAGPNRTQASNTLDALLLQGNPQAQAQINQAAGQFANLTPQLQTATTGADQSVQSAEQAAQNAAQYAQNTFNPVTTNFNTQLQNELQAAQTGNTQNQANQAAVYQAIQNGDLSKLTPDQLTMLGIQAPQAQVLQQAIADLQAGYGINTPISSAFTPGKANLPPTLANVATAPEYQESNALAQLLGPGYNAPLDQTTVNQAGTYNPVAGNPSFNTSGYANTLNQLLQGKEGPLGTPMGAMNPTQEQQYLNFLTQIAPTQAPGGYDYRSPQQVAAMNDILNLYQQGLLT